MSLSAKQWELIINSAVAVIEVAATVVPDLLASKMAKSVAFRDLAARVAKQQEELTDTEREAELARERSSG